MAVLETPAKPLPPGTPSQADAATHQQSVQGDSKVSSMHGPAVQDQASSAAAEAASPARAAGLGKSLSFSSTMAGRFSAVKPTKPSPFHLLMRRKGSGSETDGGLAGASPLGMAIAKGSSGSRAEQATSREAAAAAAVAAVASECTTDTANAAAPVVQAVKPSASVCKCKLWRDRHHSQAHQQKQARPLRMPAACLRCQARPQQKT
jgi:hypothetical protein